MEIASERLNTLLKLEQQHNKRNAKRKEWYLKNQEKLKSYQRIWSANNRERKNLYQHLYRLKKKAEQIIKEKGDEAK